MIEPNCRCPGCGECNASKEAPKLKKRNKEAAAELRRLHLVNQELVEALESIKESKMATPFIRNRSRSAIAKAKGESNE